MPSLGVEAQASGPLASRVLGTFTRSPRAVALAGGRAPGVPRSWHRVTFGGVSVAVPAIWPVRARDGRGRFLCAPTAQGDRRGNAEPEAGRSSSSIPARHRSRLHARLRSWPSPPSSTSRWSRQRTARHRPRPHRTALRRHLLQPVHLRRPGSGSVRQTMPASTESSSSGSIRRAGKTGRRRHRRGRERGDGAHDPLLPPAGLTVSRSRPGAGQAACPAVHSRKASSGRAFMTRSTVTPDRAACSQP